MLRRLRGLFVITRALLPVLVVVGAALLTYAAGQRLIDATGDYSRDLSAQLDGVRAAVNEANEGLSAISTYVTAQAAAAEELFGRVAGLRDSIDIDLPFTDELFTIPIPGVEPLKDLATDLVDAGRRVTEPVLKLGALVDVPPHLQQLSTDTAEYASEARAAIGNWIIAMILLLLIAAAIWLVAALRPLTDELSRGWAMLAGRQAPQRSLRELERRIRDLEHRLELP